MRRGLIHWDAGELPIATLQERTQRLRHAAAEAGCDAVILYTNFIRCAAVSWLTGFSPYWADGILVVTREGEPLFATTLSKRMGSWIQTVMPNGSVVTSPNPGQVAGKRLAECGARRVGILEMNDLPAGLYQDISATLTDAGFVDASEIFVRARARADEAECHLLQHASRIAQTALSRLDGIAIQNAGDAVAAVEKSARVDAAEEVYVAVAGDLDRSQSFLRISGDHPLGSRFAVRATVAYKGSWVRQIRTFSRDPQGLMAIRRADAWFAELLANVRQELPGEGITRHAAELGDSVVESWLAEGAVGTRPLSVIASNADPRLCQAPAIVLTVNLRLNTVPWCGAGLVPPQ
jgi:creatinase/prolidase-like protein